MEGLRLVGMKPLAPARKAQATSRGVAVVGHDCERCVRYQRAQQLDQMACAVVFNGLTAEIEKHELTVG